MENINQTSKPTLKETVAKFNLDMTRKDPIQVTFYHIGTSKVTSGQYMGGSMVCGMEFMQVMWIDKQTNNCKMATSVQLHNILLME
jgi:hypothetical protein